MRASICRSKTEHFKRLCKEADSDPWGSAHKAVMASSKGERSLPIINTDLLREIIITLYSTVSNESNLPTVQIDSNETVEVTIKEVLKIAKKIVGNKAPDLDGISNKALVAPVKTV